MCDNILMIQRAAEFFTEGKVVTTFNFQTFSKGTLVFQSVLIKKSDEDIFG